MRTTQDVLLNGQEPVLSRYIGHASIVERPVPDDCLARRKCADNACIHLPVPRNLGRRRRKRTHWCLSPNWAESELVYTGTNVMLGYAEQPEDLALARGITELRTLTWPGAAPMDSTDSLAGAAGPSNLPPLAWMKPSPLTT